MILNGIKQFAVKVLNAAGTIINPATEEKQDSIITAIEAIPAGGDATPYDTLIDEASSTITYIGKAVAGTATSAASWQIKRINTASGTVIRYADGVSTFTKIWDSRASYSY